MKTKSQVYHAVKPSFDLPHLQRPIVFRHVAEVETDDPERAFQMTNHTDQDWTTNDGVRAIGIVFRSTSVGDVILTPDGYGYVVAHNGIRPIGKVS